MKWFLLVALFLPHLLLAPIGVKETIHLTPVRLILTVDNEERVLAGTYSGLLQKGSGRKATYYFLVSGPTWETSFDVQVSKEDYEFYFYSKLKGIESYSLRATGAGRYPVATESSVSLRVGSESHRVPIARLKDEGQCFFKSLKLGQSGS